MAERPIIFSPEMVRTILSGCKTMTRRLASSPLAKCQPGDRLWVRETFQVPALCAVQYRATDTARIGHWDPAIGPWRPSIHMPRWASRITLEVTAVKVERLQDISEEDAEAEGVFAHVAEHSINKVYRSARGETAVRYFSALWEKLHGPGAWEANPVVVAISFRHMDQAPHA